MARKTKKLEKAEEFLKIRKRFDSSINNESENREEALIDIKFRNGDQWPEGVKKEREQEGRPCLTFNRLEGFVDQVTGDARQNKIDIKVTSVDDSPLGPLYEALVDQIERKSKATIAYQTALDHAAGNGFGWIRIATEYEPGTFNQVCKIKRVTNPFTIYPDPDAREMTKYDMKWCFVSVYMDKDDFNEKYPDKYGEPPEGRGEAYENWYGDKIRIAEYFEKRPITKTLYLLQDNSVVEDITDIPEEQIVNQREETDYEIYRSLICGHDYIEEPVKVPGKFIPLIMCPGKELHEEGKTHYRGVIRFARDAQTAYNFHRNASAESVGTAPKAPWLATADQVEGYEGVWQTANTKNHSYLPYNHKAGQPQPQRIMPPQISSGAVNEAMMAAEDLKATTGIYDASLGAKGNETSGKAILARQREGDTATFAYHDNLAIAIEQTGRTLVSMIPEVYDGERILKLKARGSNEEQDVPINKVMPDRGVMNDLSKGHYEVEVTTGPSYATQRIEARDTMMQLVQVAPELRMKALDKVFDSFDFKGAEEIADRFRPPPPGTPQPPNPELLKIQQTGEISQKELSIKEQEMAAEIQIKARDQALKERELQLKEIELQIAKGDQQVEIDKANIDAATKIRVKEIEQEMKDKEAEIELNRPEKEEKEEGPKEVVLTKPDGTQYKLDINSKVN